MRQEMNIVFGCSKEYAKYAAIMLHSLFESNNEYLINLFAMVKEDLGRWKSTIDFIVRKYNNNIQYIRLPSNNYEQKIKEFWPSLMNIDRWLAIDLLPEKVDRFLMVGIDILVKGDLYEFYNSSFDSKYMIMCRDQVIALNCDSDEEWAVTLRNYHFGRLDEKYGNSEIVLVDRNIKQIFDYNQMINSIVKNRYSLVEQDFFNIHMGNYIKFIDPYEYNYIAYLGKYEEVIGGVKILHYALRKPWIWDDYMDTEWEKLWIEYAKKTPGCEDIIEEYNQYIKSKRYILWKNSKAYHELLEEWMVIRDKNRNVLERYKFNSVALYGAGNMCKHLLYDLRQAKLQCKAIYDRNKEIIEIEGISVHHNLENYLQSIREVDVIIVTPILWEVEIKELLKRKTNTKIISLKEIIRGEKCV